MTVFVSGCGTCKQCALNLRSAAKPLSSPKSSDRKAHTAPGKGTTVRSMILMMTGKPRKRRKTMNDDDDDNNSDEALIKREGERRWC